MEDLTPQQDETLTPQQNEALARYESIIEAGMKAFLEVGQALIAIRDQRLYRRYHATFEVYCEQRWGLKSSRTYQLMAAATVVENIKETFASGDESSTTVELPANEGQIRALSKVWHEDQAAVWQKAVETAPAGKVTARHVELVVQEHQRTEQSTPQQAPRPSDEARMHALFLQAIAAVHAVEGRPQLHKALYDFFCAYVGAPPLNQPGKDQIRREILPTLRAVAKAHGRGIYAYMYEEPRKE
jgi:hypothetical protein